MAAQEFTASNNIMLFLRTGMWVSPPHFIPTFTLYFPWIENEYVQWIKKYPKLLMEKDLERVQRTDRLALGTVQGGKPLPGTSACTVHSNIIKAQDALATDSSSKFSDSHPGLGEFWVNCILDWGKRSERYRLTIKQYMCLLLLLLTVSKLLSVVIC